jgi:predicted metal-dependent hydrolase
MAEEPISSDLVLVDATNLLLPSTEKFLCRFWENVSDYLSRINHGFNYGFIS